MNTIKINYDSILNYFDNRSTNASAESFNAKIKAFRNQFRGVRKVDFFLFRLTKLFAQSPTFALDPKKSHHNFKKGHKKTPIQLNRGLESETSSD